MNGRLSSQNCLCLSNYCPKLLATLPEVITFADCMEHVLQESCIRVLHDAVQKSIEARFIGKFTG